MTIRKKMIAVSVLASTAVLVGFQNCTQTKFTPNSESSSLSLDDGTVLVDTPIDGGGVVLDPPGDEHPVDPLEVSSTGTFSITSADAGSVILVCNKFKVNLTSLKGAKLILVNSHLDWITGVSQGSEVNFVNSTASDKVKAKHSSYFKNLSEQESAQYLEKCSQLPEAVIPESTPDYLQNQVTVAGASQVPSMANKYSLTGIQENVELVNLQANSFSVTNIKDNAYVQVKTKKFQGTDVKKNARLEVL